MLVRILRSALVALLLIAVIELAGLGLSAERREAPPRPPSVAADGSKPELPATPEAELHEWVPGLVLTR